MMTIDFSMAVSAEVLAARNLVRARGDAVARLAMMLEAALEGLSEGVSRAEQLTRSVKEAAARAILAGTATADQAALVGDEAAQSGEPVKDLAQAIVSRADVFRTQVTHHVVLRRQAAAALAAATSEQALEVVLEDVRQKLAGA